MENPASVAVVTPTRGLVHSRTIVAALEALEVAERQGLVKRVDYPWWHFAHGLPIPQSHEEATEAALATGAELLWFIEDDNVPPPNSLAESVKVMRESRAGVVPVTYPLGTKGTRWDSVYREDGEVIFCGLGITLIDRKVFKKLPRPWFSLDRWYGRVAYLDDEGKRKTRLGLLDKPFPPRRGGVDVAFHLRVREVGFKIEPVPGMIGGHIRITRPGARSGSGVNDEPHIVDVWDTIDMDQKLFVAEDRDRFWDPTWPQEFKRLRPWITGFWLADKFLGGKYDAMHDPRLKLCRDQFPDVKTVLELGSLEGGHTVAISRWADQVVGIEGREANLRKARWILEIFGVTNAELMQADLETFDFGPLGSFDLVFSVGVLYHMPEPLKLIAKCADIAPRLFLWTHISETTERKAYKEAGLADPLSGLSDESTWLPKDELLAELRDRYANVTVLAESNTVAGPCITIAASQ